MLTIQEIIQKKDNKQYEMALYNFKDIKPLNNEPEAHDVKIVIKEDDEIKGLCSFNIDIHLLRSEGCKNIIIRDWLFPDRIDIPQMMLQYIKDYAIENNCSRIVFKRPVLMEGFNYPLLTLAPYNPYYYSLILEDLGFQKDAIEKGYTLIPKNTFGGAKKVNFSLNKSEKGSNYMSISWNNEKATLFLGENKGEIIEEPCEERLIFNDILIELMNQYHLRTWVVLKNSLSLNQCEKDYPAFNVNNTYKWVIYQLNL